MNRNRPQTHQGSTPPKAARWLLRRYGPPHRQAEMADDLDELFRLRSQQRSPAQARWHYWKDVLSICTRRSLHTQHDPYALPYETARGPFMLVNYLKITLRTLRKHKVYTVLNVAGLAVGMACCLLILLFVREQLAFDQFHAHKDRIHRIVASNSDDGQPTNANGSFSAGPALEKEFSEVVHAVRFRKMGWGEQRVVARGPNRFYESRFYFVDPAVFDVFTFPLQVGDPQTALVEPNTLVITAQMAQKYFPGEDPLDQTLTIDPYNDGQFIDFRVTGVAENVPATSHIQFDFLASFSSQTNRTEGWGWFPVYTYVLLTPGADIATLEASLPAFLQKHMGPEPWYSIHLQPVTDIQLRSNLRAEPEPTGDITYVYLFSALALFILLVACINFMNLATARSAQRAREVGVRKVLGAQRWQLAGQFLGEALLMSLLAVGFAVVLVALLLPVFNGISGRSLSVWEATNVPLIGGLAGLAGVAGLLAGSYPAFFLSAFRPVATLKDTMRRGTTYATALRRGLVIFQFTVSILLVICTAVVAGQMDYIRNKNLGFDREQVVVLPLNDELRTHHGAVKQAWLRDPDVLAVAFSEQVPARAGNGASYRVEGNEEFLSFARLFADPDFVETYGLELAAGRDLSEAFPTDTAEAFLVSESLVQAMGWEGLEAALGKPLTMYNDGTQRSGQIVGVVKDFHLLSLRAGLPEVVINPMPLARYNFASVRIAPGKPRRALAHLQQTWAHFAPSYPFDFYFLDEDYARLHRADAQLGQIFQASALLALLVTCLGLFGLAAFTAEQRTKEIGVRKVLGASITSIVLLLSKDFTRLVLIAFVVATPLAYLAMDRWLDAFAYRVEISAWIFLMAGLSALVIALLTISYQSIKAALTDPVESLRYE